MISSLIQKVTIQVGKIVTWLRGYEESGFVSIDSISFNTRDLIKEHGLI